MYDAVGGQQLIEQSRRLNEAMYPAPRVLTCSSCNEFQKLFAGGCPESVRAGEAGEEPFRAGDVMNNMGGWLSQQLPGIELGKCIRDASQQEAWMQSMTEAQVVGEDVWERLAPESGDVVASSAMRAAGRYKPQEELAGLVEEDERDRVFPGPLGPAACMTDPGRELAHDPVVQTLANHLVEFQITAPLQPYPKWLQRAIQLCVRFVQLCGSIPAAKGG